MRYKERARERDRMRDTVRVRQRERQTKRERGRDGQKKRERRERISPHCPCKPLSRWCHDHGWWPLVDSEREGTPWRSPEHRPAWRRVCSNLYGTRYTGYMTIHTHTHTHTHTERAALADGLWGIIDSDKWVFVLSSVHMLRWLLVGCIILTVHRRAAQLLAQLILTIYSLSFSSPEYANTAVISLSTAHTGLMIYHCGIGGVFRLSVDSQQSHNEKDSDSVVLLYRVGWCSGLQGINQL